MIIIYLSFAAAIFSSKIIWMHQYLLLFCFLFPQEIVSDIYDNLHLQQWTASIVIALFEQKIRNGAQSRHLPQRRVCCRPVLASLLLVPFLVEKSTGNPKRAGESLSLLYCHYLVSENSNTCFSKGNRAIFLYCNLHHHK